MQTCSSVATVIHLIWQQQLKQKQKQEQKEKEKQKQAQSLISQRHLKQLFWAKHCQLYLDCVCGRPETIKNSFPTLWPREDPQLQFQLPATATATNSLSLNY